MSDVTGYRSDGGALGQDQAVSGQLRSILTSKLPLLSSPGSVIENSLYYDVTSSSVAAVEMQATFAKDRIVMSNMIMGTSPTAYIPSQLFAGTLFWVVQLPDLRYPVRAGNDGLNGGLRFAAPLGWGFNAIQSVIVYMGASSIAQIEIDWYANLMVALACCETDGKRQQMLHSAGAYMDNYMEGTAIERCISGPAVANCYPSGGSSVYLPPNIGLYNAEQDLTVYFPSATACVPIRLPFTSMTVLEKKLSLDTKLLTQPIQITLQTKPASSMFVVGNNFETWQNQWANSTLQMWQEELSDKSLSVRNDLLAMPEFNVGYPFQYTQSIPFSFPAIDSGRGNVTFTGNSYNNTQITINVTSIINSDLTTMLFMVTNGCRSNLGSVPGKNAAGLTVAECNQFSPIFGEELSNMVLLLNGQRFFAFDQAIYDGVSLAKQLTKTSYRVPLAGIDQDNNRRSLYGRSSVDTTQFAPDWQDSHIYELNFSRLRAIIAESHLQNTARFTNQTFQLSFNVERGKNYILCQNANGNFIDRQSYLDNCKLNMQLHMVYLYNGVFLIGGDGGTTKLVTN